MQLLDEARREGEAFIEEAFDAVRGVVGRRVRDSIGLRGSPQPACFDEDASYLPVSGAARRIHADLPAMLIGGFASLLLQMLHPAAMAGVADHSRYEEDPLGRLRQTASFVGTTTYGSRLEALAAIERVRAVHEGVVGFTDEQVPYAANDPHLLEWVHVAELTMFLAAARAYGPTTVTRDLADRYVAEMATLARDLGIGDPPETEAQLDARLEAFRPELRMTDAGRAARNFVLRGVARSPQDRVTYATVVAAGVGVLPRWARRELELPQLPLIDSFVVRPAVTVAATALRIVLPVPRERTTRR